MKTLIVSGSYQQAEECARQNGLKQDEWKYAGNPRTIEGICNVRIIRFGAWRNHPQLDAIERVIKRANRGVPADQLAAMDPMMYGDGKTPFAGVKS